MVASGFFYNDFGRQITPLFTASPFFKKNTTIFSTDHIE
jgi:hypothetical protein